MKHLLIIAALFCSISSALVIAEATTTITTYYVGEAVTSKGNEVSRHPYINSRTIDQSAGKISEVVISYHESGYMENSSVMEIDGDKFTMTESTNTVSGSGSLIGSSWKWISLVGEFYTSGNGYTMRIVDYNLFAGDSTIMGHKDFYLTVGNNPENLLMREDVVLHKVDQQTFEEKRKELLGH